MLIFIATTSFLILFFVNEVNGLLQYQLTARTTRTFKLASFPIFWIEDDNCSKKRNILNSAENNQGRRHAVTNLLKGLVLSSGMVFEGNIQECLSVNLDVENTIASTIDEVKECSNGAIAAGKIENMYRQKIIINSLIPIPISSQNNVCIIEGQIPGAYENICMGLPERSIRLKSTGTVINIVQGEVIDQNSSDRVDSAANNRSLAGRTGVALWNSGILLTRLLDEISNKCAETKTTNALSNTVFDNKTVMELGCGVGFSSIAASKLGAKYVYATDGNEEVLEIAKFNLERNGIYSNKGDESNGEAFALQWGSLDAIDYDNVADVIIGSDLTYNSASWRSLVETLGVILKPNGYFLYLTLGHSGFNVSGELNGFLTVVQSAGLLEIVDENSKSWPFPGSGSLESLLLSSLSESEAKLTKATGGFKTIVLRRKQRR